MPERGLVTRETLRQELVVNAATKPLAIGVGATVAVAAFVLGVGWLLVVAVLVYLGIAAATFFDGDEAERVGRGVYERRRVARNDARALPGGLAPGIESLLQRARDEEERIVAAIAASDVAFDEVSVEVDVLMSEVERIAARAQKLWEYVLAQRPGLARRRLEALRLETAGDAETQRARERAAQALEDQLRAAGTLQDELDRFLAEMEHFIASLAIIHAELVRMSVSDDAGRQAHVASEVRTLRERVGAVSEGIREAVARLDDEER